MPLKINYALITAADPQQFTNSVNMAIADGWTPLGGVATVREPGKPGQPATITFSQAMIRKGINGVEIVS